MEEKEMTKQEKNWLIMTMLQIPWHEINKLPEDDASFLIQKALAIRKELLEAQKKADVQAASNLITPSHL
jgi:hypothetical protein